MPTKKTTSKSSIAGETSVKPQRGRPTAAQAAAITQAILGTARTLFLEQGFETTTMEAIAKQAGIPRSTLYKRYPDKLSILEAVVYERIQYWGSQGAATAPPAITSPTSIDDLQQSLQAQLASVFKWFATDEVRAFTRLAFGAGEGSQLVASILRDTGYAAVLDQLEATIVNYQQHIGHKMQDTRSVAVMLMSMITGWIANRPLDQTISTRKANQLSKRAVELIISGIDSW